MLDGCSDRKFEGDRVRQDAGEQTSQVSHQDRRSHRHLSEYILVEKSFLRANSVEVPSQTLGFRRVSVLRPASVGSEAPYPFPRKVQSCTHHEDRRPTNLPRLRQLSEPRRRTYPQLEGFLFLWPVGVDWIERSIPGEVAPVPYADGEAAELPSDSRRTSRQHVP